MNPDDQNNQQGGQTTPPMGGGTPAAPAAPSAEPSMGGAEPVEQQPSVAQPANCHCGKPTTAGACVGCNQPEAGCTCAPAPTV